MKIFDDKAVVGMPVYLLVAITTSSIIIAVFSLSIVHIIQNAELESVKKEHVEMKSQIVELGKAPISKPISSSPTQIDLSKMTPYEKFREQNKKFK